MKTLVCVAMLACCASEAFSGDRPTYRADDLVDAVGIAAAPFDTSTKWAMEDFTGLGIRYYRNVLRNAKTNPQQPKLMEELWRSRGTRVMFLIDPNKSKTVKCDWMKVPADGDFSFLVEDLAQYDPRCVAEIEAPNELNNKFGRNLNMKYKGRTDEAAGTLYQEDLYRALKADPRTKDIPLLLYTAIFTDYHLAGKSAAFDFLNTHSYQGDNVPSSALQRNVARTRNILPEGAAIPPFVPTECGYNVELDKTNGMGYKGSLRAQAFNVPMLIAEYFRHGIKREYLFSLPNVDGYGFLESDNKTRRPVWYAVKSFLALFSDSTWNQVERRWVGGRTFTPRTLRFELENAPSTVHTLSLQKEDGRWYLLVWNEIRNRQNGRDVDNPEVPVTVRLAPECAAQVTRAWRQEQENGVTDGAFRPLAQLPSAAKNAFALSVPSRVLVVELKPANSQSEACSAALSVDHAETTQRKVSFEISARGTDDFASVLVSRDGMFVEALARGAFEARDGRLVAKFTDESAWIYPGLKYTYDLVPVGSSGACGARVRHAATTKSGRPNLVVESFGPAKRNLKAGDETSFAGVLANVGTAPTSNPTVGEVGLYNATATLVFAVDGQTVSWGSTGGESPYAVGERRTVAPKEGPKGGAWSATPGVHVLRVVADDVNRICDEACEMDNRAAKTLTVGDFPGSVEMETRYAPHLVDVSREGLLDWIVFDKWGEGAATSVTRKRDAGLIAFPRQVGRGYVAVNPGCAIRLRWGDDATAAAGEGNRGLWGNGVGNGYELEVPADRTERVLKLYVNVTNGGWGEFAAELDDGSFPKVVDDTWNANRARGSSPVPDEARAVYTVRYRAVKDGAKLKVTWRLKGEANPYLFASQIRLQAATLSEARSAR